MPMPTQKLLVDPTDMSSFRVDTRSPTPPPPLMAVVAPFAHPARRRSPRPIAELTSKHTSRLLGGGVLVAVERVEFLAQPAHGATDSPAAVASETAVPAASSGTCRRTPPGEDQRPARRGFHVARERFIREHGLAIEQLSTE